MNLIEKLKELDDEKQQKILEKIKKEGDRYGVYPLTMSQYLLWCGYSAGENVVHHSNPGMMIRMKGISRERLSRQRNSCDRCRIRCDIAL